MAEPYTAQSADRRRHRRLPLLPARPQLADDAFLTGTNVLPGNSEVVHHVILFRVPPEDVQSAASVDAAEEGPGWTCFGGSGIDNFTDVDDAQWLGAWAPGGRESVQRPGLGVPLDAGSQIVMQVHYDLLAGDDADVSATQLRLAPAEADITPLETMLMPAPVELPCRPDHDASPLCDRDAALVDLKQRVGEGVGSTAGALYLLCGGGVPDPGPTQSCTRTLSQPMTIQGVASHMHLLGRSIRLEVNPGTSGARTVLDIPVWNFDDQGGRAIDPVRLEAGDSVRVTCRHDQRLRDVLPVFEGRRSATSSGARAPRTRCASASCRSPAPRVTGRVDQGVIAAWSVSASRQTWPRTGIPKTTSITQAVAR